MSVTEITQTNQLALHYYKENAGWTDPALRFSHIGDTYLVRDGSSVVIEQANQFDAHQIVIEDTEIDTIVSLFETNGTLFVDIEHLGVGVIAKGIVTLPDHQIDQNGEGQVTLTLPNITEELTWTRTGKGYRDSQEIAQVVINLGAITKYGESKLDYTHVNSRGVPGYDEFNRAVTTVTKGRATGWSAAYVDQPGAFQYSTGPVDWSGNVFGGWRFATFNGNTLSANPSHLQAWDGGGIGYPNTFDLTHDFAFAWQVVDTRQSLQAGLSFNIAIGQFAISFAFYIHDGIWQITESGAVRPPSGPAPANSQFTVALNAATGEIYYFVNGVKVYTSGVMPRAPLAPIAVFGSANAEIANAIVARIAPQSRMWWKVAYELQTQLAALIQLANDTNLYVRQAKDGITPLRRMEVGAFGQKSGVWFGDGTGGDLDAMQRNDSFRLVRSIRRQGPDIRTLTNLITPLGGGTGDTQVSVEHLWRIEYDPLYENFGRYKGGYNEAKGIVWPERDANYTVHRVATDAGGYEYYMRSEQSYAQWDERQGGQPDSTFTYQTDANGNSAYVELTERGLYAATIGAFRKNDQPHYAIEVETEWGYTMPRAADLVTVDYTGYGYSNGVYVDRMRVDDDFYVMKCLRTFNAEIVDTWTLSNLGKYAPSDQQAAAQGARQTAAMQVVTQTAQSVSILGVSYREIDAGNDPQFPGDHSVIYPIKILPTTFAVQAAYFRVDFLPFRQTVTVAQGGIHHHDIHIQIPDHQHAPAPGLATDATNLQHNHTISVNKPASGYANQSNKAEFLRFIPQGAEGFLESGDPVTGRTSSDAGFSILGTIPARQGPNGGTLPTNDYIPVSGAEASALHGHAFTTTVHVTDTHTFAPISTLTDTVDGVTADAGEHTHDLGPKIRDNAVPAEILVLIDSGDGTFAERTAELLDLTTGSGATGTAAGGFTNSFEFECARYINSPGRTVRLKFVSVSTTGNPFGLGCLGISGTIAASYGGLGEIVRQQQ